jgi:hypothetical protein
MSSAEVQIDRSKNKGMLIYFVVLGVAGIAILILTASKDWGFWGWFGGGLLLFTCVGSVASMAKTGGAGLASCPSCGHANEVLHVTEHRYLSCSNCKTWLEGSTEMRAVPEDHLASFPAFDLVLPESFTWPDGCPVCNGAVTRTIELEGTDVMADVAGMVAPVMMQKVVKIQAPRCEQHADGVAVRREGGQSIISFRSIGYWRRFMNTNGLRPR